VDKHRETDKLTDAMDHLCHAMSIAGVCTRCKLQCVKLQAGLCRYQYLSEYI